MKPSRNAFLGYTYQETVAFLLLVIMDVERQINNLEIEADISNNFDDIKITLNNVELFCQIKDLNNTSLSDIRVEKGFVFIKNKKHKLSSNLNIIFFKDLSVNCKLILIGTCFAEVTITRIEIYNIKAKQAYAKKRLHAPL